MVFSVERLSFLGSLLVHLFCCLCGFDCEYFSFSLRYSATLSCYSVVAGLYRRVACFFAEGRDLSS